MASLEPFTSIRALFIEPRSISTGLSFSSSSTFVGFRSLIVNIQSNRVNSLTFTHGNGFIALLTMLVKTFIPFLPYIKQHNEASNLLINIGPLYHSHKFPSFKFWEAELWLCFFFNFLKEEHLRVASLLATTSGQVSKLSRLLTNFCRFNRLIGYIFPPKTFN